MSANEADGTNLTLRSRGWWGKNDRDGFGHRSWMKNQGWRHDLFDGACFCRLATIGLSGGPMLNGKFRGTEIGSGTGVWQMTELVTAGKMPLSEFLEAESCMNRSKGHCMTMGKESTMGRM